jgi:hypothetical protein
VEIPGLGPVTLDPELGWYQSSAIRVPVLGGASRVFIVDGYDDDPSQAELHDAISVFLDLGESVLHAAAPSIFDYYLDVQSDVGDEDGFPAVGDMYPRWGLQP